MSENNSCHPESLKLSLLWLMTRLWQIEFFYFGSGLTEKTGFGVRLGYRILGLRLPFCSFCFCRGRFVSLVCLWEFVLDWVFRCHFKSSDFVYANHIVTFEQLGPMPPYVRQSLTGSLGQDKVRTGTLGCPKKTKVWILVCNLPH